MKKKGIIESCYQGLASVKLTIFCLFSVCVASIAGTLGLQDIYHSTWFQMLLVLLSINLIACTSRRFPKTLKLLKYKETKISPQKLSKYSHRWKISTPLPMDNVTSELLAVINKQFSPLRSVDQGNPYTAFAEKGRLSHWAVYIVHLSVLVILGGALAGSLLGFKGFMSLREGRGSNLVHPFGNKGFIRLPFVVRCDSFEVSFYSNGMPKDYLSHVTIIENGRETIKGTIRVNDPLTYRGITFYQASYSSTISNARIRFKDIETGKSYDVTVPFKSPSPLGVPGREDQVEILDYYDNLHGLGPALALVLFRKGESPRGAWILANYPRFHGNRLDGYAVEVLGFEKIYSTGLQVKRDPGTWVVMSGFCMLLLGLTITFFAPHRKLWVWAGREEGLTKVIVAGKGTRGNIMFDREFEIICKALEKRLKVDHE